HYNLGLALLRQGDFARGWKEHEWRFKVAPLKRSVPRDKPQWDGSDIKGKTILLHAEQGLGDCLHFIRFAPLVAKRAGRVIVESHPAAASLLRSVEGVAQVIARGQPLPPFDLHAPLLSLPRLYGVTAERLPKKVPYLNAPPAAI